MEDQLDSAGQRGAVIIDGSSAVRSERVPLLGMAAGSGGCNGGLPGYLATCQDTRILPSADALIRLELGCKTLRVEPDAERNFGNLELRALVSLLEEEDGARLSGFTTLDLSHARLGTSGALLVGRVLQHPRCQLEELNLSFQAVGPEGAAAIAEGARVCKTLHRLRMHTCKLATLGSKAFVELLAEGRGAHSLNFLDLQNNFVEYSECHALYKLAEEQDLELILQGNRVMDEVFNAITHGFGFLLCVVGSLYMYWAVQDKPTYYLHGVLPYCVAMNVLFLSSCLYHSFHALGRTVNLIFCILDHAGIYGLIAGTYTPFLVILFHGDWWAPYFLCAIWGMAVSGMVFTTCYEGPMKMHIENLFYLVMGWVCVCWVPEAYARLEFPGFALLFSGGVLYTLGVPWFVKDGHTVGLPDHVIWHIFVLAACCCHFFCVYWYIVLPGGSPAAALL